jgi:hypothetical protein
MAVDRAARTGEVVDCGPWWRELDRLYPAATALQQEPDMARGESNGR